jgi:phage shock protein C
MMKTEKKIAGVCAWLADKFELDVSVIRLVFVIATIVGIGSPILIYLIRTRMPFQAPPPQDGMSTNFTTRALEYIQI